MGTIWSLAMNAQNSPVTTPMHACCSLDPVLQLEANRRGSGCVCQLPTTLSRAAVVCFLPSFSPAQLRLFLPRAGDTAQMAMEPPGQGA